MSTKISSTWIILIPFLFFSFLRAEAATVEYELIIARQAVNMTGAPAQGMTINGAIPGPTLRFKEGDLARIRVRNTMEVDTSIHWHGILVPPGMDGVPYLTFPPIKPGSTFTYEFPIRQNGTYWYHSHSSLQEQSGVYGSIVIEPEREPERQQVHADRDHVILVSDWTDEDPHSVLRTLKRGSDWYALEKGSGQSILGAARLGMLGSYLKRELQRMPPMDIADVAYDRFLANGRPESSLTARSGETVRLRIINGSSTTYFHLEFAGGPMTIIAADGQNVEPIRYQRFLIGVAETYDVLVEIDGSGTYEFRATAHDGSGHASVWIGSGPNHPAGDIPRPNLYHSMGHHPHLKQIFALTPAGVMGMSDRAVQAGEFDRPGMMGMDPEAMDRMHDTHTMDHEEESPVVKRDMHDLKQATESAAMEMKGMDHHAAPAGVDHPPHHGMEKEQASPPARIMEGDDQAPATETPSVHSGRKFGGNFHILAADVSAAKALAVDGMDRDRPGTPYAGLTAASPTVFSPDKPVREIRLTLDGDMERYVWMLNNRALVESDSIRIREGEVVRFIMINRTMMHHPMHLHGHFFRVINGRGDFAPLKHTVDVAPMSTTVIEFAANESGDWFFHCHLLYHMESGMARVVQYENYAIDPLLAAIRPHLYMDPWYFQGSADILSNMTEGYLTLSNTRTILSAEWEAGWQEVNESEGEGTFTWSRYLNRFFHVFAGANLEAIEGETEEARGVLGFHYLLPFNLESRFWLDTDGGARASVEKTLGLTPRISLSGEAQYDTHDYWEGSVALAYLVGKNFSVLGRWHSEYGFGAGLQVRF